MSFDVETNVAPPKYTEVPEGITAQPAAAPIQQPVIQPAAPFPSQPPAQPAAYSPAPSTFPPPPAQGGTAPQQPPQFSPYKDDPYANTPDAPPPSKHTSTYMASPGAVHPFPTRAQVNAYQPLAPMSAQQNSANVTVVNTQPRPIAPYGVGTKPESYMALSIFSCLCCCWLFGLIAIMYSAQVDSSWQVGDYEGSRRNSRTALYWNIASIIGGIICGVLSGISYGVYHGTHRYYYNY